MSETAEDRDYYAAAEAAFVRRRGTPFLLSPRDFALLREWRALGVPLEAIDSGIDEAFTRREERGAVGRVNSLSYCRDAVLLAWERRAETSRGKGSRRPGGDGSGGRSPLPCAGSRRISRAWRRGGRTSGRRSRLRDARSRSSRARARRRRRSRARSPGLDRRLAKSLAEALSEAERAEVDSEAGPHARGSRRPHGRGDAREDGAGTQAEAPPREARPSPALAAVTEKNRPHREARPDRGGDRPNRRRRGVRRWSAAGRARRDKCVSGEEEILEGPRDGRAGGVRRAGSKATTPTAPAATGPSSSRRPRDGRSGSSFGRPCSGSATSTRRRSASSRSSRRLRAIGCGPACTSRAPRSATSRPGPTGSCRRPTAKRSPRPRGGFSPRSKRRCASRGVEASEVAHPGKHGRARAACAA